MSGSVSFTSHAVELSFKFHLACWVAIFLSPAHMIQFPIVAFAHAQVSAHVASMDSEKTDFVKVKSCEYAALKECLDRNHGKRERCEKEWQDFQNLCSANKKLGVWVCLGCGLFTCSILYTGLQQQANSLLQSERDAEAVSCNETERSRPAWSRGCGCGRESTAETLSAAPVDRHSSQAQHHQACWEVSS